MKSIDFLNFLLTAFPTERWEMEIVASMFERDGLIDYQEFVKALKRSGAKVTSRHMFLPLERDELISLYVVPPKRVPLTIKVFIGFNIVELTDYETR